MSTTTRYRSRETGRFVKKATWTRSKAHGGSKYVREQVQVKPRKRKAPAPIVAAPAPVQRDYQVDTTYKWSKRSGTQMTFIARGPIGANKEQVTNAIAYRLEQGRDQDGWNVTIKEWRKPGRAYAAKSESLNQFGIQTLFKESEKKLGNGSGS